MLVLYDTNPTGCEGLESTVGDKDFFYDNETSKQLGLPDGK